LRALRNRKLVLQNCKLSKSTIAKLHLGADRALSSFESLLRPQLKLRLCFCTFSPRPWFYWICY